MFELDRDHTLLLSLLALSSTPFRVTMFNGQHGIFVLLLLALVFYVKNRVTAGFLLGASYGKYSFSPLIVMVLLLRQRFAVVLLSLIPPVLGVLIAWHMVGGHLITVALEPMATAKLAEASGAGDIMSPLEIFLHQHGVATGPTFAIPAMLGLLCAIGFAIWIGRSKQMDDPMQFAVSIVLTLFCFKHGLYDFIVLIVPLAAALVAPKSISRTIVFVCTAHFWFLTTIVNRIYPKRTYALEVFIYALILLVMGIATSKLYSEPRVLTRKLENGS